MSGCGLERCEFKGWKSPEQAPTPRLVSSLAVGLETGRLMRATKDDED
jgi:hypothetical protein